MNSILNEYGVLGSLLIDPSLFPEAAELPDDMLLLENGAWAACRAPQSPAKVFQTEQAARDYLSDCESVIIIDL